MKPLLSNFPLRYQPPPRNAVKESGGILDEISSQLETTVDSNGILMAILVELKIMNFYLHEGLNIKDNPETLTKDYYQEINKITQ